MAHGEVGRTVVLELVLSFIVVRSSVVLSFGGWRWLEAGAGKP
jgi:hypothetical protein